MTDTVVPAVAEIAAKARQVADETREILQQFRKKVYEIAADVLQQILARYPEIKEERGASIEVAAPACFGDTRFGIFRIEWVQLVDGRKVQAICRMADRKAPTPMFLALPESKNGGSNVLPDRLCIGRSDRNDCKEPSIYGLLEFLDLVAADLEAVLDHIEVWPTKKN